MTGHDVSKLPKWAQQHIERQERDIAYLRAKLAVGPANSDTFLDPYANPPRPLGTGVTVEFKLGQSRVRARTDADHRGQPFLYVTGFDPIHIAPSAANVIYITSGRS